MSEQTKPQSKPTLYVVCGLPGSGKTHYAYNTLGHKYGTYVIDSDEYREELFGDVSYQDDNNKLFRTMHNDIKSHLKKGHNVVYVATNLSSKRRMAFLRELTSIPCKKWCIIMATPFEQCLENNLNRERQVPEDVMWRMYKSWQTPAMFEGWDCISLEHWYDTYRSIDAVFALRLMRFIDHDNSHHELTIGDHMIKCYEVISEDKDNYNSKDLIYATSLHDIGKPKCKTYTNRKGEPCDHAHFYGHECVGAYDVLFYDFYMLQTRQLTHEVSVLISLHMMFYSFDKSPNPQKVHEKYKKLWGEELYNKVKKLHEADQKAH